MLEHTDILIIQVRDHDNKVIKETIYYDNEQDALIKRFTQLKKKYPHYPVQILKPVLLTDKEE